MKATKYLLIGATLLTILSGCSQGQTGNKAEAVKTENVENNKGEKSMNDGKMAPDFTLKDTNGKEYKLQDLKGKKVYIKFWASWCSICLAGLNDVDKLAGEDNDFVVLSIVTPGVRNEKNKDDFIEWYKGLDTGKNLSALIDESGELLEKYGVRGYPTSVFITSDGTLAKVQPGHVATDKIKEILKNLK